MTAQDRLKALHKTIDPFAVGIIEAPPHQFNPCELVRPGPFGFWSIKADF